MNADSSSRFSFWLIPDSSAPLYEELNFILKKYSQKLQVPFTTPHLTLLGNVAINEHSAVEKLHQFAEGFKPIILELGEVSCSTTYFQCVFVRVGVTTELLSAHLALKQAMDVENDSVFMPHISLVYGDFDPQTRVKLANEITITNSTTKVSSIVMTRADDPDPATWEVVSEINFGG